jgi:2-polyprenyl-3-methyl-5-hydroxy-6-metoxy-1,4-benzoquinol methylase
MKVEYKKPPRKFKVGKEEAIEISDCGEIHLSENEMVTFVNPQGKRYDFTAKNWGFYATPSINIRLKDEGYKTALVRNSQGRFFIMVVDENKVAAFRKYLSKDNQTLVVWLDEAPLSLNLSEGYSNASCFICGKNRLGFKQAISKKPQSETDFKIKPRGYYREIWYCGNCGTYNNFHEYDFTELYSGNYNKATYANEILTKYNKILSFSFDKSDNKQRVKRINDFLVAQKKKLSGLKVLDVGSGLCVFLGEFLKHGIEAYCLDPDPISVHHAASNVKVKEAFLGTFDEFESELKFDLITFNKVLEHVKDPVKFLKKTKQHLATDGVVYIELPEGKRSSDAEGFIDREEFYIEHYTIFTERSLKYLAEASGFKPMRIDFVREPSGKYTLFSFLKRA